MLAAFGTPQAGAGAVDGPLAVDNYKRAVYRPPPSRFVVDMLPPTKQGSQYSFGMKITPILSGDRSSISSGDSRSSRGSNVEYEIWRRWEDCLWFQDSLEQEYSRLARMKRQRLLAGKGVKRDGFYLQDRASSWESLPPGPEANSVARDIHDIVPKMTKKGTLFRASQATIDQRHAELTAFVEALFADDVPTLIAELRADRIVTDFFGYWRRDYDLAMKQERVSGGKPAKPRSSITSSVLSSYFTNTDTESIRSVNSTSTSPSSPTFRTSRITVSTEAYRYAQATKLKERQKSDDPPRRRSTSSSTSSSGSSSYTRKSTGSITSTIPGIREEVPLTFDHNPQIESQKDRFLQSLPEDAELPIHSDTESVPPPVRRPKKRSSRDTLYRRSARIFTAPPNLSDVAGAPQTPTAAEWTRGIRDSWQTTASASTYLEGLNYTVPPSPAHVYHSSRLSIGSIATFMTDSSADAIIPRTPVPSMPARSTLRRSKRVSVSTAASDDGPWSDGDEDLLDSCIFDAFPMPAHLFPFREQDKKGKRPETEGGSTGASESRPETPLGQLPFIPTSPLRVQIPGRRQSIPESVLSTFSDVDMPASADVQVISVPEPPSPTFSTASTSTEFTSFTSASDMSTLSASTAATSIAGSGGSGANLTIKAAHNQSIILLRTSRDIRFSDIRQRIYDKFLVQEKIALTDAFAIAFVMPSESSSIAAARKAPPVSVKGKGTTTTTRARSNSDSLAAGTGAQSLNQMILVRNQADWERALATTTSSKITVRILDTFQE
ncbi:hypothetical protein GYMLUDRAFT_884031 [Collybiopsis luxurians FD-317 M1]|uniref:PX domain-containing protein n=1 Tax=Collybiopsis luxurians FD-317 M1 TaxID=944289 RepID=A0A0D0AX34_9AGAR|nr:hypothetical protein GYMLUDRAFT_884031 [Collybiopsis luxurians FD-317 M1]